MMTKPLPWDGPTCDYCGKPNRYYKYALDDEKKLRHNMYEDMVKLGIWNPDITEEHIAPNHLWKMVMMYLTEIPKDIINEIKTKHTKHWVKP